MRSTLLTNYWNIIIHTLSHHGSTKRLNSSIIHHTLKTNMGSALSLHSSPSSKHIAHAAIWHPQSGQQQPTSWTSSRKEDLPTKDDTQRKPRWLYVTSCQSNTSKASSTRNTGSKPPLLDSVGDAWMESGFFSHILYRDMGFWFHCKNILFLEQL